VSLLLEQPCAAPALPPLPKRQSAGFLHHSSERPMDHGCHLALLKFAVERDAGAGHASAAIAASGRASGEVSIDLALCGLASMYPPSDWSGLKAPRPAEMTLRNGGSRKGPIQSRACFVPAASQRRIAGTKS